MAELCETPRANRIHIAFFGLRNAGKSTLVNAFANQDVAIVSEVAGTTTDPVSKAMEILPLGPCLLTDTAGLDDVGELGAMRVEKTLKVLETTDIAVWVSDAGPQEKADEAHAAFVARCERLRVTVLEYRRGDSVEGLKRKIAALGFCDDTPGLLDGLAHAGDRVVCVCPIDGSAPKGRLILPQVQVIRECLDRHVACTVCQVGELSGCLGLLTSDPKGRVLVVTDSQAFSSVSRTIRAFQRADGRTISLTSFSILFARQKGDLGAFFGGLDAVSSLRDGDRVLIAEGCTHHRQCNDIGMAKIPKALAKLTGGRKLDLAFASGADFPVSRSPDFPQPFSLVVQCGGCMLTRREMLRRIGVCRAAGVPIVNYGILLAGAAGLDVRSFG